MHTKIRPRLTYANVVSTVCLFVVLGGGAYAHHRGSVGPQQIQKDAVKKRHIDRNAVATKELRPRSVRPRIVAPNAIRTRHLFDGAITADKLADGVAVSGPQGETGPQGPQGDRGLPATRLFAHVAGGNAGAEIPPSLISGSGVIDVERNSTAAGQYLVFFDRDLTGCVAVASRFGTGAFFDAFVTHVIVRIADVRVLVSAFDGNGLLVDRDVAVAVFC